jgi:tetratricopeptide (TPR) repeat protein
MSKTVRRMPCGDLQIETDQLLLKDYGIGELAARLDGLPLALATAGAFLKQSSMSFRQYLDKYNEKWHILEQTAVELPEYRDRTLYITWDLSFEQVQRQDQHRRTHAASLLRLLAYLDHQDIWYGLLHAGRSQDQPVWFVNLTSDQLLFENTIRTLADFCLVETHAATESYSLHTCVHDWTLSSLNRVIDVTLYNLAFRCIRKSINEDEADQLAFSQNRRLVPHAIRLDHGHFHGLLHDDEWVEENCHDLFCMALFLQIQGKALLAMHIYKQTLRAYEKNNGPDHISTLKAVSNLGMLYQDQGRMAEAEEMCIQVLRGKEKIYGPDHTSTLKTVNNLGVLYRNQGKMVEAEEMYIRALRGMEKIHGPDYTSTLDTVNNLGLLYRNQGRMAEAEEMCIRALRGMEEIYGPDHTSTLNTVHNLGILYQDQGKMAKAEEMYIRVLRGVEKNNGPDHISTLETVNNLGVLYRNQGKMTKAEEMYIRALCGMEKNNGPDHPSTLKTVNNLGVLYRNQGKMTKAEEMYIRALRGREKIYGPDHTSTLEVVNNLGVLYRDQGKIAEAEEMRIRVLRGRENI